MFYKTIKYYLDSSVNQDSGSKGIGSILLMHIHIYQYLYLKFQYVFWRYQSLNNKPRSIHCIKYCFQSMHEIATVNWLIIIS